MADKQQTKINFDPVEHKYSDNNGNVYTSVTTVIGKYKPPFNKKYWSMYTALRDAGFKVIPVDIGKAIKVDGNYRSLDSLYKNPINVHEVKHVVNKWTKLTEDACARGNEIHDFLEDSINISKDDKQGETNEIIKPSLNPQLNINNDLVVIKTQHDLDKTHIQDRFPVIYDRLLSYINMGCTLFAEKKIYSVYYKIAGMIDVLVVHLPTKRFCIVDWKTNKDVMLFKSGYFKKEVINGVWTKTDKFIDKKSYLYKPLDNVEDCKGMIYSLQLSLYAYLMILWDYKLVDRGLEIFHIRPGEKPKLIKVPFLYNEIHSMLEHHYDTRVLTNQPKQTIFGIR